MKFIDARIAAAGIVVAISEMEQGGVRQDALDKLAAKAQVVFQVDQAEAKDLISVAAWINNQSANKSEVIRRLQKRLRDLAGYSAVPDLLDMIDTVCGPLSEDGDDAKESVVKFLKV